MIKTISLDNLSISITIISIVVSLVAICSTAHQAMQQTRVTESINTYDNQVKNKFYRGLYFYFLLLIIVASIQFSGNIIPKGLSSKNVNTPIQTEQTNVQEESSEVKEGENQVSLEISISILISFEIIVIFGCIIVTVWSFDYIRKKYKEQFIIKNEIKDVICSIASFWVVINVAVFDFFLPFDIWIIIISTFIIYELLKSSIDLITRADRVPAKIKTIYNGEELYVYEMKDGFFLAGKDRYLMRNEEFQLISADKINGKIVSSNSTIEIENIEDNDKTNEIEELKTKIDELSIKVEEIKKYMIKKKRKSVFERIRDRFF